MDRLTHTGKEMGQSFKEILPIGLRIGIVRVMRYPACARGWRHASRQRGLVDDFPFPVTEHRTPLCRGGAYDPAMQAGKATNLLVSSAKVNLLVLSPGELFSFHAMVGWPSKLRGFRDGLELQNGQPRQGVGGGTCALTNLLYLIGIRAGLDVVERHRHKLDLFPDHGRTVPFGCGATVFFPYSDLKLSNPHPYRVLFEAVIEEDHLVGRVWSEAEPEFQYEIEERDHKFRKEGESWWRENRIFRLTKDRSGAVVGEEELVKNEGRCLYDPEAS